MKRKTKSKSISKNNKLLHGIAIAWLVISISAIIVRLPFGESKQYMDGQFWTYMVVSFANAYYAYQLMKKGKEMANISMLVIGLTYVATEIAIKLTEKGTTIGDSVFDALFPVFLIVLVYIGKVQKNLK